MRRTLKLLGLLGMAGAAWVAAGRRLVQDPAPSIRPESMPDPNVPHELRQALHRFEERFGA